MYISRITLDPGLVDFGELTRLAPDNAYRAHQQLWRLFQRNGEEQRHFLFRREISKAWPVFMVVSKEPPDDTDNRWQIETKPYAPQLSAGQPLQFQLRANPVVSRSQANGRSKRHDVVMDAKLSYPSDQRPPMAQIAQEAGERWLRGKAEQLGISLEGAPLLVEGYRQERLRKGNGQRIQFSTLDLEGQCTVTQPERFTQALYNGIGPSKAFGCGLMLVRRV